MQRAALIGLLVFILFSLMVPIGFFRSHGTAQTLGTRQDAIQKLRDSLTHRGRVKTNRATGLLDFARLNQSSSGGLVHLSAGTPREKSFAFFREQGKGFGLTNPESELRLAKEQRDGDGGVHLIFDQIYNGVPVFAGILKTHFNPAGDLRSINGVIVPDIKLNFVPSITSEEAAAVALAKVQSDSPSASRLAMRGSKLYIYRTGLTQGISGENHLVWEIEVSNGADVREFVYVDAHSRKFVDQITGIYDVMTRRIYDGENSLVYPPPSYPSNPFWIEGQTLPTGVPDADSVIDATKDTYDLYRNAFGRDSFDGAGATMEAIFNVGSARGDAQWNGKLTLFSPGTAVDDIAGHEWTHGYTQYTHNLIYRWQPGALNEAYSDIFGETIDLLNTHGLDSPGVIRQGSNCNINWNPTPILEVNSPAALQGDYAAAPAGFGPGFSLTGLTGNVVLVDDGVGFGTPPEASRTDGCQVPFRNAAQLKGNIALIDRTRFGTCTYSEKVKNAQLNGAIAVIIANDILEGEIPRPMLGEDRSITIPSALIGYSDGQAFRRPHARTLNVTLKSSEASGDDSYRWLIGEDVFRTGVRDMWQPRCDGNPGKTSDQEYFCGSDDNGGVHLNSGVPNHAYALLVDGGTYNGYTIQPLGLTKAAHIYFRAMSVYQTPTSDFADHAEALEASAADLIGIDLLDLQTGNPSGAVITTSDLDQVHKATLAVELRTPPTQCGFKPLLDPNTPEDTCTGPSMVRTVIFADDFETDPSSRWTITREALDQSIFIPRDWTWVHTLPDGRAGSGFFALDPLDDCNFPEPGQAGVLYLESPIITLPRTTTGVRLSFEHWVATEPSFDGGQVMISINGGPFKLLAPGAFVFNPYNTSLFPAVPGMLNPRAGQPAFSGSGEGTLEGSWATSIVDLTRYARPGDHVKLRWDFSTDFCFGTSLGWYVDNVRVYACQP